MALATCRAGLLCTITGALATAGGTPYAGVVLAAGLLLLAAGGWLTNQEGKRDRR